MKVRRQLYEDYRETAFFDSYDFFPTRAYDQIADLELLAHTLASDRCNVIVYCGGSHSACIVNFLRDHVGFE